MVQLKNDYCYIAHPKVLEKLMKHINDFYAGYGLDEVSIRCENLIKEKIGNPNSHVYFLTGGTSANKIVISHILKPYEAVICCDSAHINIHETGTIEQSGHKIISCNGINGKLPLDEIRNIVKKHTDFHMVKPKLIYITNATEYGTTYTLEELKSIYKYCQENNLYLFLDGARIMSSLMADDNDITLEDYAKYTDCFYIGGTKIGALLGEAVIINNPKINEDFRYSIKHYGGLYAKGYVIALQFEALFEDDLIFKLARQENEFANYLRKNLIKMGVKLFNPNTTNQVFAYFTKEQSIKILKNIACEVFLEEDDFDVIRFVTHPLLKKEDLDEAILIVKNILEGD